MLISTTNFVNLLLFKPAAEVLHEADQTYVLGAENFLFLGNRLVLRNELKKAQSKNSWLEHGITCNVLLCGFLNLASIYTEKNKFCFGIEFISAMFSAMYIFQSIVQPMLILHGTIKSKSSFYQDSGATEIVQRLNRFRTIQN